MISEQPLDMSSKPELFPSVKPPPPPLLEESPPPLTKLPAKTISSPRDFFAKLYGPAEEKSPTPPPPAGVTSSAPAVVASRLHPTAFGGGGSVYGYDPALFGLPLPGGLAAFCKLICLSFR